MPGHATKVVLEEATTTESPTTAAVGAGDNEIAVAAYYLWQERGCPIGSDQEDWYRAEALLKAPKSFVE